MKSLRNLTLAATLALIGMAGGYAGIAQAQGVVVHERPANVATPTDQPVTGIGLLLPAVQKMPEKTPAGSSDGVADLVTGAGAGKPGEANTLIGLLRPGEQSGHTDGTKPSVQMPTDQVNGDGRADLVTGAGGGTQAGLAKVGTGTLVLSNANTYRGQTTVNQGVLNQKGSLQRLGSINDLFANSRGGDQATGAHGAGGGGGAGKVAMRDISVNGDGAADLVAGAGKDGGGQAAHGAGGGGGAGKVVFQDMTFTTKVAKAGDGSVVPPNGFANPTNGGTQLPAVQAIREAAKTSPSAGGGQVAGGAAKGINFANSARK